MKKLTLIFLGLLMIMSMSAGCYGPGTVTVGEGGPWVGPHGYPGGTVWVGRPLTPVYYRLDPMDEGGSEYVQEGGITFPLERFGRDYPLK